MKRGPTGVLVAAVLAVIAAGQGCGLSLHEPSKTTLSRQCDQSVLSGKIRQAVIELGYPAQTAAGFAEMVSAWRDGRQRPVVAALSARLDDAREKCLRKEICRSELAGIEQDITKRLIAEIRRRIRVDDNYFELAEVVEYRKAQCLGYAQMFHILAGSIDLSVRPINVLELDKPGPLPAGSGHVACVVELADGRAIMANIVPGGSISEPFVLGDVFDNTGNYLRLRDKTNPLGLYRKIQILDGNGVEAYVLSNRAGEHNSAGRFEQAIADSIRAIQLCPALAEAWNNRGIARRNAGQVEEAVADYTTAIELNPLYPEAWNNRGAAYARLGRNQQAIADYTRAIELNPALAQAYSNRGNVYASIGNLTQAIADYDRAIRHNPSLAQAYGNRALNLALLGKSEQAKKDLATAARLSPSLAGYAMKVSERFNLGLSVDNAAALAAR